MTNGMILTADPRLQRILEMSQAVAASRANVLVTGESGTGKELLAKFIHAKSQRAQGPFIAINCAAVPEGLLESELFGFEKGSFTGAYASKPGKFELANNGTLLLDEVAEIPLGLQAKLLRVIQEQEVERIGSNKLVKINTRIIATTHRDLFAMVTKGEFREDLYYRLKVVAVEVPPLRLRPKDIALLSEHFLADSCQANGKAIKAFSADCQEKMAVYKWPGNVRELTHAIERSVILTPSDVIEFRDLGLEPIEANSENLVGPGMTVAQAEKLLIMKTLDFTKNNRTRAAGLLGISVRTLRNKLHEYRAEDV